MNIANLFKNTEYNESKPIITVLLETDFTKEVKIAMQNGTIMKEHKTKFPIVVQVVKGSIDFGVKEEIILLEEGSLIALDKNIPHNLKANKNSIIRLTLTKYDDTERVKNVIKN